MKPWKLAVAWWMAAGPCLIMLMVTGCQSFGPQPDNQDQKVSWNMTQSISRSGGDIAMTALLDSGINKDEATKFVQAVIDLLKQGQIQRDTFRTAVVSISKGKYSDYIDSLFMVIPSSIGATDYIPEDIKQILISFLQDGALHAAALYDPKRK